MQSQAKTVAEYLAELPDERRRAIEAVRQVILKNLDKDYEETMQYGMIGYCVPHRVYPAGYHCDPRQPLPFVCLASQKNYMSLYLMSIYGDQAEGKWFRDAWAKTGKKLDAGKSCIRFKKLEEIPLELIGEAIRRMPARKYIERVEATLATHASGKKKKAAAQKPARSRKPEEAPQAKASKAAANASQGGSKRRRARPKR